MPAIALPYRDAFGAGARPYLTLQLTAPSGANGPIIGLIDSGADTTSLPQGYASLMRYEASDLEQVEVGQVAGTVICWRAKAPCTAEIVGLSGFRMQLYPTFVPGSNTPLWGRQDFFKALDGITFDEQRQQFTLAIP